MSVAVLPVENRSPWHHCANRPDGMTQRAKTGTITLAVFQNGGPSGGLTRMGHAGGRMEPRSVLRAGRHGPIEKPRRRETTGALDMPLVLGRMAKTDRMKFR